MTHRSAASVPPPTTTTRAIRLERAASSSTPSIAPDPGEQRAEAMLLLAAIQMYDDSFFEAAAMLERALDESPDDPAFRVRTSVMLAYALFNSGQLEPGLRRVDEAVAIASRLDCPPLLGQALGMRATLRFVVGEGRDEDDMRRALELADYPLDLPLAARPAMQHALLLAWTGQLDDAARELAVIRERCVERGEESELIFLGFHSAILQVWRGNFAEAELVADDTMELALQLDGDLPLFIALTIKSMNGAYAGRVDEVRRDSADALAAAERCGSRRLSEWPITSLGFLEVSLGNYEAALGTLAPLLTILELMPRSTEIIAASYIPDAAEAMIALDRLDEAERIIDVIEGNGRRLDRAWMLAVGARCRAMLLAARGDVDAASDAGERALIEHQRLPMPFELARTQLLVGQLQRRQKHRETASATLAGGAGDIREPGHAVVGGPGSRRVEAGQRSADPGRTDRLRAAGRRACGQRRHQPRDGGGVVCQPKNGGGQPVSRLPKVGYPLSG